MRALLVFAALLLAVHGGPNDAEPSCDNGGSLVLGEVDPDSGVQEKNACVCQSYWEGDSCETIKCVNGGYKVPINPGTDERQMCHCPRGYYGIHCDAVKQARPVEGVFSTKQSFNLYIHNELTDWYGKSALTRIQRDINLIKPYDASFDSYNLLVSKRDVADLDTTKTNLDQPAFLKAVGDLQPTRTGKYTCEDTDISYSSLLAALQANKIEDSVILMYTQYPPKKDDAALAELKKYLRAFRIKLNVVIGSDDILLDCNSKKNKDKFDELTALVHFTDGEIASFLVEDDKDENELLPAFIRASASPQSHSRAASETCEKLDLVFQTDPYPNTYYIAVRSTEGNPATITGSCSSGGEISAPIASYYGEFTLFSILSGAQQRCELSVKTETECTTTVYSVGGEPDVDAFELFHSFATSLDMDSDSISSFQGDSVFLTLRIQVPEDPKYKIKKFSGDVTVKNEDQQDVRNTVLESRQDATFEYQSKDNFGCPEKGSSWILLNLEGFNVNGESVAVLNRMIHLNCEERKSADPPSKMSRMLMMMDAEETTKKPPTNLVLMYSNWLPISQFSNFILEGVRKEVIESKFTHYGYLRFDAKPIMDFKTTDDFSAFRKDVYDYAPDATLTKQENLNQHLQKLTSDPATAIHSDSLVSIAIQHSMVKADDLPSNLAELANLGATLLFWGDVSTVKTEEESDTLAKFTRMAAVSAGHVVLMDMDDFTDDVDDDGEQPFYVALALRDLYSFGPSQRLLAYSNLEWAQTSTSTSQSSAIGSLQVAEATTEVFVSITLNVANPSDVSPAFMLSIVLAGASDRIVLNIEDFTQYGTPGFVKSNLYTANFTVLGGETYDGTFTVLAMTPFTGAHIRFWTARTDSDIIPDLKYVDFKEKDARPDDYLGAALRVPDSVGETMNLRFLDKNGMQATRLDNNQTVDVVDNVAHFVPYFCASNHSDADPGLDFGNDMYTIEITYDSGFKYFRPLMCSKGKNPEPDCQQITNDNTYCTESNPPFHRGPSQKLIDCSGVGQVVYSTAPDAVNNYKCVCDTGFDGQSCEQSSCAAGIVHRPEEDDTSFRTLSYVLVSPAGGDACTALFMNYAEEAKKLFSETPKEYPNIWQYTFSVYFTDGTAKTMYRGPNYADFYAQFGVFTKDDFDTDNFCGDEKKAIPMDLNEVYNLAVESVGRNSRGVVFLYVAQSFADETKNQLKVAFDSNELYQSIQSYQQHIYVVTPTITPEFIALTTASGGFAVTTYKNWDNDVSAELFRGIFDDILRSKIGWAGVTTEAKSRSGTDKNLWTVKQNAEIFVTSNGGTLPVLTGVTAPIDTFYVDPDFDDGTVTQHATIDASAGAVSIGITFGAEKDYKLVQVVILTKEKPIRYALIGQSQANTDKHAAGATNSSEKAVHISFDQLATKYFFNPASENWRQASRINCSFAQEFVAFEQPFKNVGASVVDFTVSPMIEQSPGKLVPDTGSSFSLSVPLAVSEIMECGEHGTFIEEGSYCKCEPADWSGPTCSQPACAEGGRLNAHGDHCDCSEAQFGGLFCKEDTKKKSAFDEEE